MTEGETETGPEPKSRGYLGGPPYKTLEHALMIVRQAFDAECYLVGSVLRTPDYRDVDVRMIMDDVPFNALFGDVASYGWSPLWSLLTSAISAYLSQMTSLPVDFQIQRRSSVRTSDWNKPREPMCLYLANDEMLPAWLRVPGTPS